MHLSMLSPRGGGGEPRAYVGHLNFIAFPTLGNLTKNSGSQGGDICLFCAEEWDQVTSSHVLGCAPAILELK